ncbi:MAG: hypothetical protein A2504_17600 [Bdellovibrionales bacterium RIFOXYD12_FULL_39_22]|nr:MAG: hypothetical protein A2385_15300 [Bdellovibrionales bacterium RIFOXYB1_FULL_39_21]OFZ40625.1 MAG: hypothetical protein A2485_03465 [Bdellovibrionales bacterium RIFOXYC12_FULL_39_17]OFZ50427.1 MAG: hypothetical protein A2404_02600 [Bdellovibrionales bacterium RIFOXYC1_FULL_39_130]OFZ71288.1 MAG: hypothetical protein A2451_00830 [Bdellovibrionales bacterium RIFOXYC2_FULL_39_8]OFZ77686.1 MAG: hypothetical protein A2560_04970 [Bdellovibrionales bacterium RIFOXYD1_FULL_39_84]OFZ91720.1 MAG:
MSDDTTTSFNTNNYRLNKKMRKKLLIYPKFQLVLLVVNAATITTCLAFVVFQIISFFNHMRELGVSAGFGEFHAYFKFIRLQEETIISNLLVALLLAIIFSTIVYVFLSHKVSGPIVRLQSFFSAIAEKGTFSKLSFRKNDFFDELPPIINSALLSVADLNKQSMGGEVEEGSGTDEAD